MRAGRIVLIVCGALAALIGFGLTTGGGALIWAHTTQRDASGYYTSGAHGYATSTAALTSTADFGATAGPDWASFARIGTLRLQVRSSQPMFVGVAPRADVDAWLAGVAHDRVTDVSFSPFRVTYQRRPGAALPSPPASQAFWVASVSGPGLQTLTWDLHHGQWALVVMNSDATPGVAADVAVGAKTGLLLPIGIGLGVTGLLLLGASALMLVLGVRRDEPAGTAASGPDRTVPAPAAVPRGTSQPAAAGNPAAPYPARLDGHLDQPLSRWLWLVKWLLVIPHLILLAFLWIAVSVLTVVAGLAILFTGRYPRSIFDFNVGVMRWTWRVSFFSFSALGTDRYPPFTLDPDPTYPADFDVDYPDRLSRGLVLVKWWLLAIPQYLIVAAFAGGALAPFGWGTGGWRTAGGIGLIGILVVVAAVMLAVQGRYPESLFDFIMGMNRWCYRVLAYAALLRDEYPPFRLDTGGTDPGSVPVPRPGAPEPPADQPPVPPAPVPGAEAPAPPPPELEPAGTRS